MLASTVQSAEVEGTKSNGYQCRNGNHPMTSVLLIYHKRVFCPVWKVTQTFVVCFKFPTVLAKDIVNM
jgi:hypothetical protein